MDSVDANGCIDVPEGVDFGGGLDWDFINAYRTGGTIYE